MSRFDLVCLLRRRLTALAKEKQRPMLRVEKEHLIREALDEMEPLEAASPEEQLAYTKRVGQAYLCAGELIDSPAYTGSKLEVLLEERAILLERHSRVSLRLHAYAEAEKEIKRKARALAKTLWGLR